MPSGIQLHDLAAAAEAAFGRWVDASNNQIRVRVAEVTDEVAIAADGVNTIQFVENGWERRGFDPTAAGISDISYVQNRSGNWTIAEADLYLNAEAHTFRLSPDTESQGRDLNSVLTHEVGHVLGLWHPCELGGVDGAPDCGTRPEFAQLTMYPIYAASQVSLAADDIAGVDFLYGVPSCENGGCLPGFTCSSDGCRQACGDALCGVDEFCTADGCWPIDECYGDSCEAQCGVDADCGEGQLCAANACVGKSLPGDPCRVSGNCVTGICSEHGACLASCADCEDDACEARVDGTFGCRSAKRELGAECNAPDYCLGGECLAGGQPTSVCTRRCSVGADACPMGWRCSSVDEIYVCIPSTNVQARGGCTVSAVSIPSVSGPWSLITFTVLLLRRRGRRALLEPRQSVT